MKKVNNWYPVQVWLMTIVVFGPVFLLVSLLIDLHDFRDFIQDLGFMLFTILYGLIYSLPVLVTDFLLFKLLTRLHSSVFLIKVILIAVSIIGMVITFHFLALDVIFVVYLSYSLAVIISCAIMNPFKPVKQKGSDQLSAEQ